MSSFPLGEDIAWSLIALAALSVGLLIWGVSASAAFGTPADDTPDDAGADDDTGDLRTPLADLVSAVAKPVLTSSVLTALLLLAVPGAGEDRGIRVGALLAGTVLGIIVVWQLITRPGRGLAVVLGGAGALVALAVAVLKAAAGVPLVIAALGLGITAAAMWAAVAVTGAGTLSARTLVGALELDGERSPGEHDAAITHAVTRATVLLSRGALTVLIAGVLIQVGVPLLGAHAILLAILTLIAAQAAYALTHVAHPALAAGFPAALLAAGLGILLPGRYAQLRFTQVGLAELGDPLLLSLFLPPNPDGSMPAPVNRDLIEPQIEEMAANFDQFQQGLDDSPAVQRVVDLILLHGQSPSALVAGALAAGALIAAVLVLLVRSTVRPGQQAVAARTGHVGAGLAGIRPVALVLLGIGAIAAVSAGVIMTVGHGNAPLGLLLTVILAAGGAVVLAALPAAESKREAESSSELAVREAAPAGVLSAVLTGSAVFALLAPTAAFMTGTTRLPVLWEDRALRTLTTESLTSWAGALLAALLAVALWAMLADVLRRTSADAVLDSREAAEEKRQVRLDSRAPRTRVIALVPGLLAPAAVVAVSLGFGGAALLPFAGAAAGIAGLLLVVAEMRAAGARGALAEYDADRFGGVGSWGHTSVLIESANAQVQQLIARSTAAGLLLAGVLSSVLAPFAADFFASGSNPWLRLVLAVAAALVGAALWVYCRNVTEPDLR